jgi:hypothetical protein
MSAPLGDPLPKAATTASEARHVQLLHYLHDTRDVVREALRAVQSYEMRRPATDLSDAEYRHHYHMLSLADALARLEEED